MRNNFLLLFLLCLCTISFAAEKDKPACKAITGHGMKTVFCHLHNLNAKGAVAHFNSLELPFRTRMKNEFPLIYNIVQIHKHGLDEKNSVFLDIAKGYYEEYKHFKNRNVKIKSKDQGKVEFRFLKDRLSYVKKILDRIEKKVKAMNNYEESELKKKEAIEKKTIYYNELQSCKKQLSIINQKNEDLEEELRNYIDRFAKNLKHYQDSIEQVIIAKNTIPPFLPPKRPFNENQESHTKEILELKNQVDILLGSNNVLGELLEKCRTNSDIYRHYPLGDPVIILFDENACSVDQKYATLIDSIATILINNPNKTIGIKGYSDTNGMVNIRKFISECRATETEELILEHGVNMDQIRFAMGRFSAGSNMDNKKKSRKVIIQFYLKKPIEP